MHQLPQKPQKAATHLSQDTIKHGHQQKNCRKMNCTTNVN